MKRYFTPENGESKATEQAMAMYRDPQKRPTSALIYTQYDTSKVEFGNIPKTILKLACFLRRTTSRATAEARELWGSGARD